MESAKRYKTLGTPDYANFRHAAYTHSPTQPKVLFYTLYTFKRNKRHSPSLTLSTLSRETRDTLLHSHSLYLSKK